MLQYNESLQIVIGIIIEARNKLNKMYTVFIIESICNS